MSVQLTSFMVEEPNNNRKMTDMLLQESVWKVEDKVNVILESMADQEAEVIRLKRHMTQVLERLAEIEKHTQSRSHQ